MTAQKGKDLLLKLDSTGTGSFVTVAGLRSRSLSFNAQTIDVTNADSAGAWRELLGEAGIKSAALSGSGIFKDAATDATTRDFFFAGTIRDWQVILPGFGTVEGPFQITGLDYAGEHNGEMTYELTLASAGALTFTAA
ncbi:phage major tail protein, TP901-1 family [Pyruvatibacter mobilis]|uniref:phage major tail protein, TP901-1 family n=1 Tax=Pyruvatibacter mobilis TaxID=1712261 RepID=UPI0004015283